MASPFQKYQGGGFDLPNIAQVGANIGETYQRGLSDFGKSIGEGIKSYDSGIAQNQAADAKLAAAIRNTGMLASALEMHPDYKDIAGSLAAKLEEYKTVTGKGLGPKLAAINDLETSSQSIQQAIQYQNMAAEAMAMQAYNETPEKKMMNAHGVLAEMGYNPGVTGSLDKAIQRLLSQVNKNNTEQGVKPGDLGYTDPQKALNDLLGRARLGLKQAVAQDPKNLTLLNAEGELEGAVKRYAGIEKLKGASGLSDIGSGILDIYKGVTQQYEATTAMEPEVDPMSLPYGAGMTNVSAADKAGMIPGVASTEISAFMTPEQRAKMKAAQNLTTEQRQALSQRDADIENLALTKEGENLDKYKSNKYVAEGAMMILEKLKNGETVTYEDKANALGMAANLDGRYRNWRKLQTGEEADIRNANAKRLKELLSKYEDVINMSDPAYRALKYPNRNPSSPLPSEDRLKQQKMLREFEAEVTKITKDNEALLSDVSRESIAKDVLSETAAETAKSPSLKLDITANRAVEQQVTPDERMALAKEALAKSDYVQKRFGGRIPAAALQSLQSKILTPPPMVTDPATGARLYQSAPGKWEQLKVDKPDATMQVNQTLFSPGHESITGGRQKQFVIQGTFKGGNEKEKTAFVAQTQKRARALTSIDRLLEINEGTAESLRPSLIGEAETIVNEIISSNRVDLIGPGQVAVAEWQMLEKLVRNPAKLIELDSVTKANLMRLRQRMQDVMYDEAYANGLSLTPATSGAEVGRGIRMQNLVNRVPQQ